MSGLENMKRRILSEADHSVKEKLAAASAEADRIRAQAKEEAEKEAARILAGAQEDAKEYARRVESSCEMQRKQALLKAKQEVIAEVLEQAYTRIMTMEVGPYFEMLGRMLEKYALPQEGTVYFSEKDLKRMPEDFRENIEKTAREKGGHLVLSEEAKKMDGGFILVYGGIEENCTIQAMFHARKEELSDRVHQVLFV